MSEQHAPDPDDFPTWLTERGADAYALAWVAPRNDDPANWDPAEAPQVGTTGIARPGTDWTRVTLEEVSRGRLETLRRWLHLDNGTRQLAILEADPEAPSGLREHTPGDLAVSVLDAPDTGQAPLIDLLASWLSRRQADAPQGLELGWIAAAAAWTCHLRSFITAPPLLVLSRCLDTVGEHDEATKDLIITTSLQTAELLSGLGHPFPKRADLVHDWRAAASLATDVPELQETADWLLDSIALRDAHAQQLRAVLEPDITDHVRDRHVQAADTLTLDPARTTYLTQAHQLVRAYTAAAYSGREAEAQHLLDAFPIPARSLEESGPAATWRRHSSFAREAVNALAKQRSQSAAENVTDYFTDPELVHAQNSYLAAREGQLHLVHDALGRLAFPTATPADLPDELLEFASAQTQRRISEAFGTNDRARRALDGQITYLLQQPLPAHRAATTGTETALLATARDALLQVTAPATHLDAEDIRARLQQTMARPITSAPQGPGRPAPGRNDQDHAQALTAGPATPGVQL